MTAATSVPTTASKGKRVIAIPRMANVDAIGFPKNARTASRESAQMLLLLLAILSVCAVCIAPIADAREHQE